MALTVAHRLIPSSLSMNSHSTKGAQTMNLLTKSVRTMTQTLYPCHSLSRPKHYTRKKNPFTRMTMMALRTYGDKTPTTLMSSMQLARFQSTMRI